VLLPVSCAKAQMVGQSSMRYGLAAGLLLICTPASFALEAKWTPNGEAPAPFSKRARENMGMDPSAFAGGASQPVARGSTLRLGFGSMAVLYLANNWNVVIALKAMLLSLLEPVFRALSSQKTRAKAAAAAASAEEARLARLERLKANKNQAKSSSRPASKSSRK